MQACGKDRVERKPFLRPARKQFDQPAAAQKILTADFDDLRDAEASFTGANQRARIRSKQTTLHMQRQHFAFASQFPLVWPSVRCIVEVDAVALFDFLRMLRLAVRLCRTARRR
jgi:hypothetical protein